jgi:hypothetical protein
LAKRAQTLRGIDLFHVGGPTQSGGAGEGTACGEAASEGLPHHPEERAERRRRRRRRRRRETRETIARDSEKLSSE